MKPIYAISDALKYKVLVTPLACPHGISIYRKLAVSPPVNF